MRLVVIAVVELKYMKSLLERVGVLLAELRKRSAAHVQKQMITKFTTLA